jgi:hypothetical protein
MSTEVWLMLRNTVFVVLVCVLLLTVARPG